MTSKLLTLAALGCAFAAGLSAGTIVTGAGAGGGPLVSAFDDQSLALQQSFFAYNPAFTGGVRVAAGVLNGQQIIVTGAGPGGGPQVEVIGPASNLLASFFAYDPLFTDGVFVA